MKNASNVLSGSYSYKRVKIGGGGYVIGQNKVDDVHVHATDVGGAFIKTASDTEWRPLLTSSSMPTADFDPKPDNGTLQDSPGCPAVNIAPSNKAHIALVFNSWLYRSTNTGATFLRMALPAKRWLSNSGTQRFWHDKIVFHPTDPNTMLVGTDGDGIYYTQNAGTSGGTWTAISGITAGTSFNGHPPPHLVAFDPGASTNVFVSKYGTGVYRSTTGVTGTFSLITGGPPLPTCLVVDSVGTLWVCNYTNTSSNIWKLARGSSTWVQLANPTFAQTVAVDNADVNSVVGVEDSGSQVRSINGGTSWVGGDTWRGNFPPPVGVKYNPTRVPWLGGTMYPSKAMFDPIGTNKCWLANGLGMAWSNPPSTFVRWDWYDDTIGNDELGFVQILSIPGNSRPLFTCYDKAIWRPVDLDRYSGKPIFPTGGGVEHGHAIDYGAGAPNFVAAIVNFNNAVSGYSLDGGANWQPFASQHPDGTQYGGAICCPGPGKVIWLPGNNGKGVRSSDYGTTWQPLTINGVQLGGWLNAIFLPRQPIAADKQRPGHVVMVLKNDPAQSIPDAGVWKSTDSGATSTKVFSGVIDTSFGADGAQFYRCKIDYIEGKPSELLYCGGNGFNSKLMYSSNDAVSWAAIRGSEIDKVTKFGFGKGLPGAAYPAVVFAGFFNGISGIYVSYDFFATPPILTTRFPVGLINDVDAVSGDMNIIGRIYATVSGMGLVYCDLKDTASIT